MCMLVVCIGICHLCSVIESGSPLNFYYSLQIDPKQATAKGAPTGNNSAGMQYVLGVFVQKIRLCSH